MRITRLEIFGFKSFRDRFALNFDQDLVGVVGPNGCGKSNIVDALRWILGEKSAKQLRGSVLEDLIFNGSDTRRPLGMAEVSITIRPEEGWARRVQQTEQEIVQETAEEALGQEPEAAKPELELPSGVLEITGLLDSAEIQLTRRLYRSGESEYFINRIPCRLRDLTDLYRLIGLGARGLSIVQQGQVGEIISKKPVERRELLEEAAGISGFRARLEAAERKLTRTSENTARLTDIITEVDKQVRNLRRQANRARTRAELKENLETVELSAFESKYARLSLRQKNQQKEFQEISSELQTTKGRLHVLEANEEGLRGELETLDVELVAQHRMRNDLMSRANERRMRESEVEIELAKISGTLRGSKEQLASTESGLEHLRGEIEKYQVRREEEEESLTKRRPILEAKQLELVELVSASSSVSSDGKEGSSEDILEELNRLITAAHGLSNLALEFDGADIQLEQLASRLEDLRDSALSGEALADSAKKELEFLQEQLESCRSLLTRQRGFLSKQERLGELFKREMGALSALQGDSLREERALREELQELLLEVRGLERSKSEVEERLSGLEEEQEGARGARKTLLEQIRSLELEQESAARSLEHIREREVGVPENKQAEVEEQCLQIDRRIDEVESERNIVREKLGDISQELALARREFDKQNDCLNTQKLALEKFSLEANLFVEEIQKSYGGGVFAPSEEKISEILSAHAGDLNEYITGLQEEGIKIRRRLEREGEVDPEAISLYEQESKRLEQMKTQRADLEEASRTLQKTIRQLKEISRKRFTETFEAVSVKFAELMPRLFGGGAGRLDLVNPEDPLTSGIEITVRPPGKHLRSMELLSGGEKALSATAILMAMFLHRPSPICVLDEVDAPLDDANLERFLNLIRENADKAQFLIITHNKLTMSAVDRLVGITMQEKGVSNAVSVSLEEAEQHIEKQVVNA